MKIALAHVEDAEHNACGGKEYQPCKYPRVFVHNYHINWHLKPSLPPYFVLEELPSDETWNFVVEYILSATEKHTHLKM